MSGGARAGSDLELVLTRSRRFCKAWILEELMCVVFQHLFQKVLCRTGILGGFVSASLLLYRDLSYEEVPRYANIIS